MATHRMRMISRAADRDARSCLVSNLGRVDWRDPAAVFEYAHPDGSPPTRVSLTEHDYPTDFWLTVNDIVYADASHPADAVRNNESAAWVERFAETPAALWTHRWPCRITCRGVAVEDGYATGALWRTFINAQFGVPMDSVQRRVRMPISLPIVPPLAPVVVAPPWPLPSIKITLPRYVKVTGAKYDPETGEYEIMFE